MSVSEPQHRFARGRLVINHTALLWLFAALTPAAIAQNNDELNAKPTLHGFDLPSDFAKIQTPTFRRPGPRVQISRPRPSDGALADSISPRAAEDKRPQALESITVEGQRERTGPRKAPPVEQRIAQAAGEGFYDYGQTYAKCIGPLCTACMRTGLGWACGDPISSIGVNLREWFR